MSKQVQITLVRSLIGRPENQRATVNTLGLKKINQSVVHNDTPAIRGMINTVPHLLKVTEVKINPTKYSRYKALQKK